MSLLRAAHREDADAIARVFVESRRRFLPFAPLVHTDDEVRAWVRELLIPTGGVFVYEREGHVVAMLALSRAPEGAWIDQLYVLPGHTGEGIGELLLRHAHATLPRPIRLYTFQDNHGARRFYERHGYRPRAFGDGHGNAERCPDVLYELAGPQGV